MPVPDSIPPVLLQPMNKLAIVSVLFLFLQACNRPETITREEVIETIGKFDKGWKGKDSVIVNEVLAPSYIYFTRSGGTFNRGNVVYTAGSPDYLLDTVQRKLFDIQLEGNTAIANTVWIARGSYFEKPFFDTQRCSITVIKEKGKLQILSEHCTPIKKD